MKDNFGIPVEVCQKNRSPRRSNVLCSFGRSLAYVRLTGYPRRSLLDPRDPNPSSTQAGVYPALGPQGLGRELFTRAGLMVFVSVRCLCGAAHVTLHSHAHERTHARTRTHVGPLLLVLVVASRPPLASSDRPRISSTTYFFTSPQISIWVIVKLF